MNAKYDKQQIDVTIKRLADHEQPHQTCKDLSRCMSNLIEEDQNYMLQESMADIWGLYSRDTDNTTKIAIENVLLYHIGTHIAMCPNRIEVFELFPEQFKKIIIRQFTCAGI
jgi:hypothetical protein